MDKTAPLSADMLKGIVGGSAKQRGPHMTDLLIVETENGVEVYNPATKQDAARLAAPKLDGMPTKADLALQTGVPVVNNGETGGAFDTVMKELHLDRFFRR